VLTRGGPSALYGKCLHTFIYLFDSLDQKSRSDIVFRSCYNAVMSTLARVRNDFRLSVASARRSAVAADHDSSPEACGESDLSSRSDPEKVFLMKDANKSHPHAFS
jgi:hypothetical protein